jgi:hypothetical protein
LIHSCFSLNRLPRVNGMYVSYLSDLTFLSCPSLRGLKNPPLKKGKAGIPSTLRTEKRTVWRPMFPYNGPVLRTSCASHVIHEILSGRWVRRPRPAPRRLLSNLLRACAPRTPYLLDCVSNPCSNCHFRISFTLKLSLGTHTTAKCQGPLMVAALLILRIRIFRWSEGAFNLCLLSGSCVPRRWLRW